MSDGSNPIPPGGSSLDALTRHLSQGKRQEVQRDRATKQWLNRSNRVRQAEANMNFQRRIYMGKILTR